MVHHSKSGIPTSRLITSQTNPANRLMLHGVPVMQSTKYEFVINVKTAKSLGVKISDNLLLLLV